MSEADKRQETDGKAVASGFFMRRSFMRGFFMWGPYLLWGLALVLLVLLLDQVSKWWILNALDLPARQTIEILPFLSFSMVWNRGISMGIPIELLTGANGLIILTALISVWLLVWLARSVRVLEAVALGLIIGGAVGNIIDRLMYGAVVDFIHLHAGGYDFYVFNVADAAISLGVALLIWDAVRDMRSAALQRDKNLPKKADKT